MVGAVRDGLGDHPGLDQLGDALAPGGRSSGADGLANLDLHDAGVVADQAHDGDVVRTDQASRGRCGDVGHYASPLTMSTVSLSKSGARGMRTISAKLHWGH